MSTETLISIHPIKAREFPFYRVLALSTLLSALLVFAMWTQEATDLYERLEQTHRLKRDLGFTGSSPWVYAGGKREEVFVLDSVDPNGIFGLGGARPGEIIATNYGRDFCRELEERRGETVAVTLIPGGDGPPLDQRPTRKITVSIPKADEN